MKQSVYVLHALCVVTPCMYVIQFIVRYIVEPSHRFPYCLRATSVGTVQSPNFQTFKQPKHRFQGTNSAWLCSL
jgi:hypothetical protein